MVLQFSLRETLTNQVTKSGVQRLHFWWPWVGAQLSGLDWKMVDFWRHKPGDLFSDIRL